MLALVQSENDTQSAVYPADEADVRVLERRIFGRRRTQAQVDARRLDHSIHARRNPRVSMRVRDLSVGGMSALSDVPLQCGENLGVNFPPELGQRGWQAFGRVVRCDPSPTGYRLAIEFETLPAA